LAELSAGKGRERINRLSDFKNAGHAKREKCLLNQLRRMNEMTDFPTLRVSLDGAFSVISAPDRAHFPLAWLTSNDRAKGCIQTKKDLVIFTPTEGDVVMYKITGYDTTARRFEGTKI
jgi:hypothetical protein